MNVPSTLKLIVISFLTNKLQVLSNLNTSPTLIKLLTSLLSSCQYLSTKICCPSSEFSVSLHSQLEGGGVQGWCPHAGCAPSHLLLLYYTPNYACVLFGFLGCIHSSLLLHDICRRIFSSPFCPYFTAVNALAYYFRFCLYKDHVWSFGGHRIKRFMKYKRNFSFTLSPLPFLSLSSLLLKHNWERFIVTKYSQYWKIVTQINQRKQKQIKTLNNRNQRHKNID